MSKLLEFFHKLAGAGTGTATDTGKQVSREYHIYIWINTYLCVL